jgi:hypothetical protein
MSTAVFGAPEWRARSGRTVKQREDGALVIGTLDGYLNREAVLDAEEWAQAKHDADLGRWRDPFEPHYVVYSEDGGDAARVLDERDGVTVVANRRVESTDTGYYGAAFRFFEAHPERKPWQDAKPGEVWELTTRDEESVPAMSSSSDSGVVIFTAATHDAGGTEEIVSYSDYITAGRRIWPEDAS